MKQRSTVFHGVEFSDVQSDVVTEEILRYAHAGEMLLVEYLAVNNLVLAIRHPQFRQTIASFDLRLQDGRPLAWLARFVHGRGAGQHIPARSHMLHLCARAESQSLPIGLYGSRPEVVARLRDNLVRAYPGLKIAFSEPSVFRDIGDTELRGLCERISGSGARLLFVALGCPLQETFAVRCREFLSMPVICVGSAFDIHAGLRRNPPDWVSSIGFEWLFRLVQDPTRLWRRYASTNVFFIGYAVTFLFGAITKSLLGIIGVKN